MLQNRHKLLNKCSSEKTVERNDALSHFEKLNLISGTVV